MATPDEEGSVRNSEALSVSSQDIRNAYGPVVGPISGGTVSFVTNVDIESDGPRTLDFRQRAFLGLAGATAASALVAMLVMTKSTRVNDILAVGMVAAALLVLATVLLPWSRILRGRRPTEARTSLVSARDLLLDRIYFLWIDQALHRSLQHVVAVEVGLDAQLDAVASPWATTILESLNDPQPLPAGTRLSHIFGKRGVQRLLLLGAPGSGKTTHLLQLTEDLIEVAAAGPESAIPIVLRLSEWTSGSQNLVTWLEFELGLRYGVNSTQVREWLESGSLIVLLDGLDEVGGSRRQRCLEAIVAFCLDSAYSGVGMVLTCRSADYEALHTRLPMEYGVRVRPLEPAQVAIVLDELGDQLIALNAALRENSDLVELLTTPLMLGIAILATRGLPPGSSIPPETLYSSYMRRMLTRSRALMDSEVDPTKGRHFTPEATWRYLVWLARLMNRSAQVVFYQDWITPAWLPGRESVWKVPRRRGPLNSLANRIGWDHLSTAVVGAGYAGALSMAAGAPLGAQVGAWKGAVAVAVISGLTCSGVAFLAFGFLLQDPRIGRFFRPWLGSDAEMPFSASKWLWSWRGFFVGLGRGAAAALVVDALGIPLSSLGQGLGVAAVMVFGGGLSGGNVPDNRQPPTSPGRALSASLRRLALLLLILTAAVLLGAIVCAALSGPWAAAVAALPLTAALMLVSGPGRAWMRNRAATFGVVASGVLPARLGELLVHADERILMRRAGGGFQFLHRTLQDFLATQDPDEAPT